MIRFVLRVVALIALGVAIYLVVFSPTATVLQSNLLTKVGIQVKCSSVLSQWTHHAQPASLLLDGRPLASVPEAQSSCTSASHKIEGVAIGLVVGAGVLTGLSLVRRLRR
jgi:hypothetical protein